MQISITHHFTKDVLFACDAENLCKAVEQAAASGAYLIGANLRGAYLVGANLDGANLVGANLDGANLRGANLRGANLDDAILRGAYLDGANLRGANLRGANLDDAILDGANLRGAYLIGANLIGETLLIAPISIANLTWPVLITHKYMRIGCRRHSHEEWASFTKNDIQDMHSSAFEFWFGAWRTPLLQMCETHRNKCEAQSRKD